VSTPMRGGILALPGQEPLHCNGCVAVQDRNGSTARMQHELAPSLFAP
jgi:hypothetical protein